MDPIIAQAHETGPSTPLMRQYRAIKKEHPNALLFFRLGDFYELFFDDAVTAARELQITLTSRNKEKGTAIPMCGVPYHAAEGYIAKLIRKGFKVAICDQMEDPRLAKQLVRREVTRVITPGTAADATLQSEENNFLAAVARGSAGKNASAGFAALDLSTGEFRATEFIGEDADRRIFEELEQLRPREVLYGSTLPLFEIGGSGSDRLGAAGPTGSMAAICFSICLVISGRAGAPSGVENLMPLYSGGLWEAVKLMAPSAWLRITAQAMAGVGAGSAITRTVMPWAERMSDAISTKVSPRKRGSRPTTMLAPSGFFEAT